jgi:hypothetical protein
MLSRETEHSRAGKDRAWLGMDRKKEKRWQGWVGQSSKGDWKG